MRPEALKTLDQIKRLARLESWIRCAKAELASTPQDRFLSEFIRVNEKILRDERERQRAA